MNVLEDAREEQRTVKPRVVLGAGITQRKQRRRGEVRIRKQALYSFFISISSPIPTSSPSLSPIFVGSAG
jgi:hypothetical protein